MRYLITFIVAGALGAVAVVAAPAQKPDRAAAAFAQLIDGKTADKPMACIDTRFSKPQLSAYGSKLAYRVSRKLVYVSDTGGGCEGVARGDTLVTRQFQTRLCRGDIAQTVNLPSGMFTGSCAFGDFVPYHAK